MSNLAEIEEVNLWSLDRHVRGDGAAYWIGRCRETLDQIEQNVPMTSGEGQSSTTL